jgi:hypothetical protein
MQAAATGGSPVEASAQLQKHLDGALMQRAPTCARVVAELYAAADPHQQQVPLLYHGVW